MSPALLTVVRQRTLGKKPAGLPAQLETRTAKSGGRYPARLARAASDQSRPCSEELARIPECLFSNFWPLQEAHDPDRKTPIDRVSGTLLEGRNFA